MKERIGKKAAGLVSIIAFSVLFFSYPSISFADFEMTRSPSGSSGPKDMEFTFTSDAASDFTDIDPSATHFQFWGTSDFDWIDEVCYLVATDRSVMTEVDLTVMMDGTDLWDGAIEIHTYDSEANCELDNYSGNAGGLSFSYTVEEEEEVDEGFIASLNNSEAIFASTTGFSMGALTAWAADDLIKVFIGSGLAIIYNLRFWIVAVMIIGAVILFSYRAFRFFRH